MKTYIIYLAGEESGYVKAKNHNEAERKARKMFYKYPPLQVSVAYTEI